MSDRNKTNAGYVSSLSVLWPGCFCGLPMPPIGLIAAVHNNLSPFIRDRRSEGKDSGKTDERQGKTGERREE